MCYMALESAPKTTSFLGQLCSFLWCELLERGYIGSIDVHWDDAQV